MTLPASLTYVGAFVVALAILVVIHELGHFLVARVFDVKVLRFSFGFGKTLWLRRFGPDLTEWAICAIPLGGYVKMLDERETAVQTSEVARAFNRQSLWKRVLIVAAGPLANLLLAVGLYTLVFLNGVYEFRPIVGAPPSGTVAAAAGIAAGSRIVSINDQLVDTWQEARWILLNDLLNGETVDIAMSGPKGELVRHTLAAPKGLGDTPEKDALRVLGFVLMPLKTSAVVGTVSDKSPAEKAGLRSGDRIDGVNGISVTEWNGFAALIRSSAGVPVELDVVRGETMLRITAVPDRVDIEGNLVGRLGVAPVVPSIETDPRAVLTTYGVVASLSKGLDVTIETSILTLRMIGRMLAGSISWHNVSGPITMADYAGQSAQLGLSAYLRFLALISISLGVLNLLPIPVLDGGHLLYYLAEAVRGKPLPDSIVNMAQQVGMVVLGFLMVFAFYNDFSRLVSG